MPVAVTVFVSTFLEWPGSLATSVCMYSHSDILVAVMKQDRKMASVLHMHVKIILLARAC